MNGHAVKVLVVDDDPAAKKTMETILEEFGYACVSAQDGMEALETLTDKSVDLLVTDLDMPRLGGLELIERVRKNDPNLPIMIMTSRSDFETAQQALRLGVSDYLVKPIDHPAEVRAAARRAIESTEVRDDADALAWEMSGKAECPSEREEGGNGNGSQSKDAPHIRGYRLQEVVGKGATGTVYKAIQVANHRVVALKVLVLVIW